MMELLIFIATLVYRYDYKLVNPEPKELEVAEGFLRKVRLFSLYFFRRFQEADSVSYSHWDA
jgi:hypothetical protein